ncbi:PEP-CTERM sorting domain-containing protein [Leptolyngbya sp. FACHB-17]|uniref:PEP-CTERM sorting domain-containing protein n=1 Tax=unclassified Leptolyngbya TaxID=2650499 RepID=UPI0032207CA2
MRYKVSLQDNGMTLIKSFVSAMAVSAIAALSHAGSAQAITFNITSGVAGPNGVTNQGAYSDFWNKKGTTTIDFNSGSVPTTGFAKYSFQNNSGTSSVRQDVWAPAGPNGEVNQGSYLAVFQGDSVTIKLEKTLNYFGMNWGAISPGNVFSFFMGDQLIKSFSTEDVNPVAPVKAEQHGGEGNGYLHFYSEGKNDLFNRIVITQTGGGGFESDNHSFHIADDGDVRKVPEPTAVLGLMAAGGALLLKRRTQAQLEE